MQKGSDMEGCARNFVLFMFIVSLLTSLLAVLLPFWVSTKVDNGVQEVQVVRNIDSGLWWKYDRFDAKPESFPESDDWFTRIFGTNFHTKSVTSVTGLMLTGLALLFVSFVWFFLLSCFRCCGKQDHFRPQFIVITVTLFLAAGFFVVGLIVFYKQVLDDYKLGESDEHLGASFWLAVASTFLAFLTGVCATVFTCRRPKLK